MSNIMARTGSRNPEHGTGDTTFQAVRCLRDGTLPVADFAMVMAMEGRVFSAQVGAVTTPTTFRIGHTTLQPEAVIDVPNGTAAIPLSVGVYLEDSAGTDTEIVLTAGNALRGAGTSTAGVIYNLATDAPVQSTCKFYYTYAGNATALSNAVEFFRSGHAFADAATVPPRLFQWSAFQDVPPLLVGPASLSIYISATTTAPAGFLIVKFAEVQTRWIV